MKYTVELVSKKTVEVEAETGADAAIAAQAQLGEEYHIRSVYNDKDNEIVVCALCMKDIDFDVDKYTADDDGHYFHNSCLDEE